MAILVISLTDKTTQCARTRLAAVLVASYASSSMRNLPACVESSLATNVALMRVHAHSLMRLPRGCVNYCDPLANAIDVPVCSLMTGRRSCVRNGATKGIVFEATRSAGIVILSNLESSQP
jgi:hypothetical protein